MTTYVPKVSNVISCASHNGDRIVTIKQDFGFEYELIRFKCKDPNYEICVSVRNTNDNYGVCHICTYVDRCYVDKNNGIIISSRNKNGKYELMKINKSAIDIVKLSRHVIFYFEDESHMSELFNDLVSYK